MRRLFFAWWLAGLTLFGQVNSVFIASPSARIVAGDTIQLQALGRNSQGIPQQNVSFNWTSTAPAIVSVDSAGKATGAGIGWADITASAGSLRSTIRIQVLPLRIVVTPGTQEIQVGDSLTYKASVLDRNGAALTGAPVQWQVLNTGGGTANGMAMTDGLLQAFGSGRFTVRAGISYNAGIGFVTQAWGDAVVTVKPPARYRLTPLLSSDMGRNSYQLRPKRGYLAVNATGQQAFAASLEGVANGILTYQDGRTELPLAAGMPGPFPGTLITETLDPSINSSGDVLVRTNVWGSGSSLAFVTRDGARWLVNDNAAGGGAVNITNIFSTPWSAGAATEGEALFRARFRWSGTNDFLMGLFVARGSQLSVAVADGDRLPGMTSPVVFEDQFGMDEKRNLYFRAFDGRNRAVFRRDASGVVKSLLSVGQDLAGSPVQGFVGGWSQLIGQTGELVVACQLNNRVTLARWKDPSSNSAPEVMPLQSFNALYSSHSTSGTLFLGNGGSGYGIYLWGSGAPQPVLLQNRPSALGELVSDFYAAGLTAAGDIYATVQGSERPWILVKVTQGNLSVLLSTASQVNVPAPLSFTGGPQGDHANGFLLTMGGSQWSLFDISEAGLLPRLVPGDKIPGGALFNGDWSPRRASNGDVYLMTGAGMYRLTATGATLVQRFQTQTEDRTTLNHPSFYLPNAAGTVVATTGTNDGHSRIVLLEGGKITTAAYYGSTNANRRSTLPAGGTLDNFNDLAIDDAGRLMGNFRVQNGPSGLYLYRNNAWEASCLIGSCTMAGETVTAISALRGAGEFFTAHITTSSMRHIARWQNNDWRALLSTGARLPSGTAANSFGLMDMNRIGEVAFTAGDAGTSLFVVGDRGVRLVQNANIPLDNGVLLRNFMFVDLKDDNRLVFTAMDVFERVWAYAATLVE